MIRPININLNAAHPELPLVEATTFTGAPSSVFIRGVPKAVGNWSITAVSVAVTYPDNTTTARAAVESAEGVWVATIPGTATSGRTAAGFKIMADGIDENGAAVTGYVLGFADFAVLSFFPVPAPGETFFYLRYFDTMPTAAKKMDVTTIDGILKYYNGATWLPFTDLSNYYTAEQTDEAIERVAAYYITYNAAGAAFPTRADLINAQTYYSGGVVRVPTRNDYAVVLADETHDGAEWRYIYAVADGETVGQWGAQYPVGGVIAYDNTVTPTSGNVVKSSGIWAAIWGTATTAFSSLYDWVVAQFSLKRDYSDLSYNTTETETVPALHAVLTRSADGSVMSVEDLFCDKDAPDTPVVGETYTWTNADESVRITQSVKQLQTDWQLYIAGESVAVKTTMNAQGFYPDLYFEDLIVTDPSSGDLLANMSVSKTTAEKKTTVEDSLAKKSEVDSALAGKVSKSGDTMTGALTIEESNTIGVPFLLRQNQRTFDISSPTLFGGRWIITYSKTGEPASGVFLPELPRGSYSSVLALAAQHPTAGHLAALDADGNPTDAGYRFEVRNGIPYIIETTND